MTQLEAIPPSGPTREEVLGAALAPFAEELKLIDPGELICLCLAEKHSNINDVVESAAEMFFQRGTLRYAGAAEVQASWEAPPRIVLDMEFQNAQVVALFRLTLGAGPIEVDICHVLDAAEIDRRAAPGAALSHSLSAASLTPRETPVPRQP